MELYAVIPLVVVMLTMGEVALVVALVPENPPPREHASTDEALAPVNPPALPEPPKFS
jgi:hypothetical protein